MDCARMSLCEVKRFDADRTLRRIRPHRSAWLTSIRRSSHKETTSSRRSPIASRPRPSSCWTHSCSSRDRDQDPPTPNPDPTIGVRPTCYPTHPHPPCPPLRHPTIPGPTTPPGAGPPQSGPTGKAPARTTPTAGNARPAEPSATESYGAAAETSGTKRHPAAAEAAAAERHAAATEPTAAEATATPTLSGSRIRQHKRQRQCRGTDNKERFHDRLLCWPRCPHVVM